MPTIRELLSSDPAFFAQLDGAIRATCRRYERDPDDVDDIVGESWLTITKPGVGLKHPARARAWVSRVVQRVCLRRIATRRRELAILNSLRSTEPVFPTYPDPILDQALADARKLLLRTLPRGQFDILVERVVAHRSLAEIARGRGMTLGAVKQQLHRARTSLREQYAGLRRDLEDREEALPDDLRSAMQADDPWCFPNEPADFKHNIDESTKADRRD